MTDGIAGLNHYHHCLHYNNYGTDIFLEVLLQKNNYLLLTVSDQAYQAYNTDLHFLFRFFKYLFLTYCLVAQSNDEMEVASADELSSAGRPKSAHRESADSGEICSGCST